MKETWSDTFLSCRFNSVVAFSERSGLSPVSSGAASQAAMVDASVAADTKKPWEGMAKAAGRGGG